MIRLFTRFTKPMPGVTCSTDGFIATHINHIRS